MNKKFRAWCRRDFDMPDGPLKFNQITIQDNVYFQHLFGKGAENELLYDFQVPFLRSEWIVEQWTSLIDNQGIEIFEGDIVNVGVMGNVFEVKFGKINREALCQDEIGKIWPLEFNGFYFEHILTKLPCLSIVHNELGVHDLTMTKVIGNIHQGF